MEPHADSSEEPAMRRAVLLVFVLSYLVTACAGENTGSAPVAAQPAGESSTAALRLAGAPAATAAAGTARTTIIATVTGLPGRPEPLTFRGDGVIDFDAGMSRSILDLSDAIGSTQTDTTELETMTAGGLLYVRAPMLSFLSDAPEPWVRIDTMATSHDGVGVGTLGLAPLAGLAGSDGGAPIAMLAAVDASSVQEIFSVEERNGAFTTLRAVVEPSASFPEGTPGDLVALEAFLDRLGARQLEVEVELDEANRLRRLVYEHAVPTPGGTAHQRFEVQYRDFGSVVDIEPPVDSEVRDLLEVLQGPR